MKMEQIKVGIIMGSASDLPVMKDAREILNDFGVECEVQIVSAHRTPEKMVDYAKNASKRFQQIIENTYIFKIAAYKLHLSWPITAMFSAYFPAY